MNGVKSIASLPYFARGEVIKGFGRGSKELGIPTANFPESVVDKLPSDISAGVYYGWGQVDDGVMCKMVMSIGWNPYYNNTKKSMETHLMHKFDSDFYGRELAVVMLGYIRAERNFASLEELISAIEEDIRFAKEKLESSEARSYLSHEFFKTVCNGGTINSDTDNGIHSNL